MPTLRRYVPAALIVGIAGALLYAGWVTYAEPAKAVCSVCGRPVHLASRADGVADGEALTFCCAACALRSQGRSIPVLKVTRVFDYFSGEALDPKDALTVVGSEVNLCMREHVLMDAHKEAAELHFDRCAPSVLAFASEQAAERFQAEHGGVVKPFVKLKESFE